MEENRALRVVDLLRDRGVNAHLERPSIYQFGVRVDLRDGRHAVWDTDGTIRLEAQVMRDGVLVGYVPQIEGSEEFDDEQTVTAIAATDYDRPIATRAPVPSSSTPLPRVGGITRRFRGGLRE